jgi:hypothetical protein
MRMNGRRGVKGMSRRGAGEGDEQEKVSEGMGRERRGERVRVWVGGSAGRGLVKGWTREV